VSGTAYSAQLAAAGNPVGTWTQSGLPGGLVLNPTTGAITGNPGPVLVTWTATVTFGFTQTNTGFSTSKTLTIKVVGLV
jgi:hypothetical protein